MALRDVMDHAVKLQREITEPKPLRRSRGKEIVAALFCVPLIAISAYSWIARPEFIWGPKERAIAPQRQEANLRLSMFLLARRIESHQKAAGAYPVSLTALGTSTDGVSYRVTSDSTFELSATLNGKPLVLHSSDDAGSFLGRTPLIPVKPK